MSPTYLKLTAAVLALAVSSQVQASVVFSDDFESYPLQLNAPMTPNWTVTNGTVDVIGSPPPFFDFLPGNGHYVDLAGSTGAFGLLSTVSSFAAGNYTLSFALAGTQRSPDNTTRISLGNWSTSLSPLASDPFTTYTFSFTTTGGVLSFQDSGPAGNEGNLLDNVVLSAVPEPSTWALMIAGFTVVGFGLRRRAPARMARFA